MTKAQSTRACGGDPQMRPPPGNDSYHSLTGRHGPLTQESELGVRAPWLREMGSPSSIACWRSWEACRGQDHPRPTESDSPHTVPLPSPTFASSQAKWSWVHQVLRIPGVVGAPGGKEGKGSGKHPFSGLVGGTSGHKIPEFQRCSPL